MTREITTSTRTPKKATRGTVSYEDQAISTRAIALLAGAQQVSIDVHGAGQQGARLSLTWGTLLLGFTAADQVDALRQAFAGSQSAAKRIPERLDPKILSAEIGDEAYLPAISVGFREVPRCGGSTHTLAPGRLDSWAHRRHCLHIRVGVLLFRVFDQSAHASTLACLPAPRPSRPRPCRSTPEPGEGAGHGLSPPSRLSTHSRSAGLEVTAGAAPSSPATPTDPDTSTRARGHPP